MHPTLNDHEYYMRPACVVHAVWRHFILVPSTPFSQVSWLVLWLRHQFVTDVTAWLTNPNLSCSKNRKRKQKIKFKKKRTEKEKIKTESTVNDLDNILLRDLLLVSYWSLWLMIATTRVADRRRLGVKGRKDIYTKGWSIESRDNLIIPWYTSSRIWRDIICQVHLSRKHIPIVYSLSTANLNKAHLLQ